jgi:rubrerythrin
MLERLWNDCPKIDIGLEKKFGTIVLPPGLGKTKVAVEIAKHYNKVLVIVPTTVLKEQWKDEFIKWGNTNELRIECFAAAHKISEGSSYEEFDLVIIDESHDIINHLKIHINYNYLWMISGTYEDLLKKVYNSNNSLIYSNTSKELMNDEFINLMLVKNNNTFIKNSFKIPEPIEKYYLCKLHNNINIIKNFISDSILDKINANDISGAIKDLGGKNENENDIIELVSKELKRELFNKQAERDYITNLDILPEQKILKLKTINHDIENQEEKIKNLTERISYISSKTCSICMELITNPILIECTHIFCGGCLLKWLKNNNNCPYCRANINGTDKLIAIVNDSKTVDDNNNNKEMILSNEETLLKIINDKPDGKFLIFIKNENSFEKINNELKLSQREWTCTHCNTTHDRDILAANNIKRFGLRTQPNKRQREAIACA